MLQHIAFGSKNCPIPKQSFITPRGPVTIQEAGKKEIPEIAKLIENEFWPDEIEIDFEKLARRRAGEEIYLKTIFNQKDGNATVLTARTPQNELVGVAVMGKADYYNDLKLDGVGRITSCCIKSEYQKNGLGKKFIDLLLNSVKGRYTDVVLESKNNAINFYEKLGFKRWPESLKPLDDYVKRYSRNLPLHKNLDQKNTWIKQTQEELAKKNGELEFNITNVKGYENLRERAHEIYKKEYRFFAT
ncbi:MAG: hypothetical protein A2Y25_08985 [Candidatus Melainabacteria bacterium GWF2_37_15]|nr:MAG: hypothetical protein A2Y25_08985 [Candidatus Melainabacteria bacterium GWF2_37_15]